MRYVVLAAVLTGCGGSAFEAGAAHESDAATALEAGQERDAGGGAEASLPEASSDAGASLPTGVAFCATLSGITDGGPPAVYGCGKDWRAYIDAGLVVPEASFEIETFDGVANGQLSVASMCDSSRSTTFDCPDDAGGIGVNDCQIQLVPGNSGVDTLNGHCVRSPYPPFGFAGW